MPKSSTEPLLLNFKGGGGFGTASSKCAAPFCSRSAGTINALFFAPAGLFNPLLYQLIYWAKVKIPTQSAVMQPVLA
jgi:hypothetical protein